jgi:hypothetical protein
VEFKSESDVVYGIARDIGFAPRQSSETRKRALRLFARHGTPRDIPLLLSIAKNDPSHSVRLTATEVLPQLGIRSFEGDKKKATWMGTKCD